MSIQKIPGGRIGTARFVLSKGHTAPALYGALALRGFFPEEEIPKLRHTGAMLQGHPDMKGTPGVDMSTGSLGQGISAAVGMAHTTVLRLPGRSSAESSSSYDSSGENPGSTFSTPLSSAV